MRARALLAFLVLLALGAAGAAWWLRGGDEERGEGASPSAVVAAPDARPAEALGGTDGPLAAEERLGAKDAVDVAPDERAPLVLEDAPEEDRDGDAALAHRLEGRVTWPDGAPAADARLTVRQATVAARGWKGGLHRLDADADGRFRLDLPHAAACKVSAEAARERPGLAADAPEARGFAELRDVAPDGPPLAVVLAPMLGLRGRVVDDARRPLPAFTVRAVLLVDGAGPESTFAAFEDAQGRFALAVPRAGEWRLEATTDDGLRSEPGAAAVPQLGEEVELVLPRPAMLAGRVVGPDGRAAGGARVLARSSRTTLNDELGYMDPDRGLVVGRAGGEGDFEVEVPAGWLLVRADRPDLVESAAQRVEVLPGGRLDGMVLALRAGGRITGEVHGSQGEVAGRQVSWEREPDEDGFLGWALPGEATTDERGRFELERLIPGTYHLELAPPKGEPQAGSAPTAASSELRASVALAEGEERHVVLGAPSAEAVRLVGRVTSAGAPAEDEPVRAFALRADVRKPEPLRATTDAAGRFELRLGAPGRHRVSVGGWDRSVSFDLDVPPVAVHEVELALPTGTITGTVRDAGGAPAVGVSVALGKAESPELWIELLEPGISSARTDERGRFTLERVRPGEYRVFAGELEEFDGTSTPLAYALAPLTVPPSGRVDGLDLTLAAAGGVEGTIVTSEGAPLEGVLVRATDAAGRSLSPLGLVGFSTGGGRFRTTPLPPGRAVLWVTDGLSEGEKKEVVVEAGEVATVELVLKQR